MTVGSVIKALKDLKTVMESPREAYSLIGANPIMKMDIEAGGHSAQMQVIDKETGHQVATMEYYKDSGEFTFNLFDKNSGVVKTSFEIKPDGKAYIGGKELATIDMIGAGASLFQFDYKTKVGTVDATPPSGKISFDNADYKLATKLYIHKKDRTHTDMSLFLKSIKKGDYFNIHDNGNIGDFIAFDVTADVIQNGDIFEVAVTKFDDNGVIVDNERVFVHWEKVEASGGASGNLKSDGFS